MHILYEILATTTPAVTGMGPPPHLSIPYTTTGKHRLKQSVYIHCQNVYRNGCIILCDLNIIVHLL